MKNATTTTQKSRIERVRDAMIRKQGGYDRTRYYRDEKGVAREASYGNKWHGGVLVEDLKYKAMAAGGLG